MSWFSSNLEVRVEVDGEKVTDGGTFFSLPWNSYHGRSTLLNIAEPVTGKVFIKCPPNYKSWIQGVSVVLDETAHSMDIFTTLETARIEVIIGEPMLVEADLELDFSISLDRGDSLIKRKWHDSYNGETFGLRHCITAQLLRPWYIVFNDPVYASVHLYQTFPPSATPSNEPLTLELFEIAKSCSVTLSSQWAQAGQCIDVRMEVEDVKKPLDYAHLSIYRTECLEENTVDGVIATLRLLGPELKGEQDSSTDTNGGTFLKVLRRVDSDDPSPRSSDGIRRGTRMELQLCVDPALPPSFDTCAQGLLSAYDDTNHSANAAAHKDAVAVRYYIRFFVIDAGGDSFWNTAELFLYRGAKPTSLVGTLPQESSSDSDTRRVSISQVV